MITLAFYKARGTWVDRLIRAVTRGSYSHVELIIGPVRPDGFRQSVSASGRDGGVRMKSIMFDPAKWDLIDAPVGDYARAVQFCVNQCSQPYDYLGALLAPFLWARTENKGRWFCSELVAAALGMPVPSKITPSGLAKLIEKNGGEYAE